MRARRGVPEKEEKNDYYTHTYIIVGLDWHRRCKALYVHWGWRWLATTLSNMPVTAWARQSGNFFFFFLFFGGHNDGYRVTVDQVVRGGEP